MKFINGLYIHSIRFNELKTKLRRNIFLKYHNCLIISFFHHGTSLKISGNEF